MISMKEGEQIEPGLLRGTWSYIQMMRMLSTSESYAVKTLPKRVWIFSKDITLLVWLDSQLRKLGLPVMGGTALKAYMVVTPPFLSPLIGLWIKFLIKTRGPLIINTGRKPT